MKIALNLLGALGTVLAGSSQAATIAGWNFDSVVPTLNDSAAGPTVAASTGSGSFRGVHASADTDWVAYAGNGSNSCYGGDNNWTVGDYFQFSTSTTGFEDITISVDQSSHPDGPRDFQLSYSTDGTNFTNFGSVYAIPRQSPSTGIWQAAGPRLANAIFSFDLSSITDLDDAGTVYFRLSVASNIAADNGALLGSRSVIDNVIVSGTAVVPEPGVTLLGAIGMLGLLRRGR